MRLVNNTPLRRTPSTDRVKAKAPGMRGSPHFPAHWPLYCLFFAVLFGNYEPCLASRLIQVQVPLLSQASKQLTPHFRLLLKRYLLTEACYLDHVIQNTAFLPLTFSHRSALFFLGNIHFNLTLYYMLVFRTMSQLQPQFHESHNCLSPMLPYPKVYYQSGHPVECKKYLLNCINQLLSTKYLLGAKPSAKHCR